MRISILGTVGIPALYGGFETLAENLVKFHHDRKLSGNFIVFCSSLRNPQHRLSYFGARLYYIKLSANGISSILYDIVSILLAIRCKSDVILLLGVSGAIALPLVRIFSSVRIITNIDGLEWKRAKWNSFARWFLKLSERLAVRYSHEVIADNIGIQNYITTTYNRASHFIPYGGDSAIAIPTKPFSKVLLPSKYAFALCRIEPENNIAMILEGFSGQEALPLVFVGNWHNSEYGKILHEIYKELPNIYLLDSIYDVGVLRNLREKASLYVHGHSAGGTNPSLVEMMHFSLPIFAFDCIYNRYTTDNNAIFFNTALELRSQIKELEPRRATEIAAALKILATEQYNWESVGCAYMNLLIPSKSGLEMTPAQ